MISLSYLTLTFVLSVFSVYGVSQGNILLIPFPCANYWYRAACLAEGLRLYGYNTTVVIPDSKTAAEVLTRFGIDLITSHGMTKSMEMFDKAAKVAVSNGFSGIKTSTDEVKGIEDVCSNVVYDIELLGHLQERHFYIAVLSMSWSNLCISVIPYKLSIPYIRLEDMAINMGIRNVLQIHPAVFPADYLLPYNDKMTYIERLVNTFYYSLFILNPVKYNYGPAGIVGTLAPEKRHLTNDELQAKTELYLLENDELLDYHLPRYPNVIPVGGLVTRPAAQLPGYLKLYMDSGEDGVVIVSLGTVVKWFPNNVKDKVITALHGLPTFKFIFKADTDEIIDGNTLMMRWLPQNDLLGHPKARLLISQCGMNAQYEALFHAVPMVCIPVFGDQHYNAIRIKSKGYGLSLNADNITEQSLRSVINEVLNEPRYRQNIANASVIFKNKILTPRRRAAWWIDHVIKYGGKHLQPPVTNLPYYQFLLVDVLAGSMFIFAILCFIVCMCFKYSFGAYGKQKHKID